MSQSIETAREDLAFLRGLVDDGDWRRPLRFFGAAYTAVGVAIVAQVTLDFAMRNISAPAVSPLGTIIAVWVAYSLVQALICFRLGDKAAPGLRNRAGGAGMIAMMLSHFTMLIVFAITTFRLHDENFLRLAVLVFFALQGGLWIILNTLRPARSSLGLAVAWFVGAIAAAPFLDTPRFGPVVGLIILLLMVAPGLSMLRRSYRPD